MNLESLKRYDKPPELSFDQKQTLSLEAQRLFSVITKRANHRDATQISVLDTSACDYAGCKPSDLYAIQAELQREGLMHVELIRRPKMQPVDYRSMYILGLDAEQQAEHA